MSYDQYLPELKAKILAYCKRRLKNYPKLEKLAYVISSRVLEEYKGKILEGEPINLFVYMGQYYVDGVAKRTKVLEELKEVIESSSYYLIVIVGAGFSFEAGLPLGKHLKMLLKQIGAKSFEELRTDRKKDMNFKNLFKKLSEKARITEATEIIATKFKEKIILEILSLNWDNIIEKAYGDSIPKINREEQRPVDYDNDGVLHYLWKFHGDVMDLEYEWIYPFKDSKGRIFTSFCNYIPTLIEKFPMSMLIIGYSEQDNEIRESVIEILSSRIQTYRIGFDFNLFSKYPDYIFAPSEWAILYIFKE